MTMIDAATVLELDLSYEIGKLSLGEDSSSEDLRAAKDHILDRAKENYRRLARVHHPDMGGNADKMKELINAMDMIKNINIIIKRPEPVMQTIIVRYNYSGMMNSTGYTPYYTNTFTNASSF